MTDSDTPQMTDASLAKGMMAGMIGGLVAIAAKTLVERISPSRTNGVSEIASWPIDENLAGKSEFRAIQGVASDGIPWGFGAVAGAAYGALVEYYPAARSKDGASFGVALGSLIHQGALPLLGNPAEEQDQTLREQASEFSSHIVYGVVTEGVRRFVRRLL